MRKPPVRTIIADDKKTGIPDKNTVSTVEKERKEGLERRI